MPKSRGEAREVTRAGLEELGARRVNEGGPAGGIWAEWDAGWRAELQYCRLKCLYSQVEVANAEAHLFQSLYDQVIPEADRKAKKFLTRCLALVVVVADDVSNLQRVEWSRFQRPARAFVSPVLVDLPGGQVLTVAIEGKGFGFDPYRQTILRTVFGPVTMVSASGV